MFHKSRYANLVSPYARQRDRRPARSNHPVHRHRRRVHVAAADVSGHGRHRASPPRTATTCRSPSMLRDGSCYSRRALLTPSAGRILTGAALFYLRRYCSMNSSNSRSDGRARPTFPITNAQVVIRKRIKPSMGGSVVPPLDSQSRMAASRNSCSAGPIIDDAFLFCESCYTTRAQPKSLQPRPRPGVRPFFIA